MSAAIEYQKGKELLKERKLDEALKHFNKALELSPDEPHVLSDRGVVYFHMKKNELSIIDLDKAVSLEPDNPYRYSSRAYVRSAIGDIRGGIDDYKKAIQLDPNDAIAHNNLGLLEEKLGYQKSAKTHYNKADEIAKNDEFYASLYGKKDADKTENKTTHTELEIEENIGYWSLVFQVFKKKDTFKEFLRFLKNGFKLK